MSVNAGVTNDLIWPNYSKENLSKVKSTGEAKSLGKDDFLKILLTQLSNQDPLQPMQDTEFIAQMAQFTSLEQLMGISSQINLLQQSMGMSSNLIGREITWIEDGTSNTLDGEVLEPGARTGTVDSIIIRSGEQFARVGNIEVAMANIAEIRAAGSGGSSDSSTDSSQAGASI